MLPPCPQHCPERTGGAAEQNFRSASVTATTTTAASSSRTLVKLRVTWSGPAQHGGSFRSRPVSSSPAQLAFSQDGAVSDGLRLADGRVGGLGARPCRVASVSTRQRTVQERPAGAGKSPFILLNNDLHHVCGMKAALLRPPRHK